MASNLVNGSLSVGIIENSLTLSQTVEMPAIRSVFKGETAMIAFSLSKILVDRFLASFGFSTKHNETQIEVIAADVLESFKYESLQDLILFLKMARTGKFGATNRGIDSNLILGDWMPMYLELKAEERERKHAKEQSERLKVEVSPQQIIKQNQINTAKSIREKKEKEFRDYVEQMTKGITREQLETLIEKCDQVPEVKEFMHILKEKRRVILRRCSCCFRDEVATINKVFITSKRDNKLYCHQCYIENH